MNLFNLKKILKKETQIPMLNSDHKYFEMQKLFRSGKYTAFSYVPYHGWAMLTREPIWDDVEYFICLNKHSNVCRYSLNNMDTELETEFFSDFYNSIFKEWIPISIDQSWSVSHPFMDEKLNLRISPKAKC